MVRAAVVAISALALGACVTTGSTMIDERTAIISGRSHAGKSVAEVRHKMLVEAATAARKRGFDYFQVVTVEDQTRAGVIYLPGQTTSTTTGSATCAFNTCSGSATTQENGYGPRAMPYVQPGATITIHFYHEGEIDPAAPHVWSVRSILSAITQLTTLPLRTATLAAMAVS